jgi:hypothetical protein
MWNRYIRIKWYLIAHKEVLIVGGAMIAYAGIITGCVAILTKRDIHLRLSQECINMLNNDGHSLTIKVPRRRTTVHIAKIQ